VFLHPHDDGTEYGVVEGAQGQFALVGEGPDRVRRLAPAPGMGALASPTGTSVLAIDAVAGRLLEDVGPYIAAAWARRHPTAVAR